MSFLHKYNKFAYICYDICFEHLSAPVSDSQIIDKTFIILILVSLISISGFRRFSTDIIQRVPQKYVSTAVKYSNFTAIGKILAI